MHPASDAVVGNLRRSVIDPLKQRFVGRDEVVDLIALAIVAREHLFLYGPPGTAKSALIRQFAQGIDGRYFEYLLTRFSEPNEIFGPIDIARLREGTVATVTTGMLPEAEVVFLDELFNANSAILNNLLTVLNERVYRRGAEMHRLPLVSLFSASNHLPEDDALRALFDRFLLRCQVKNLKREAMPSLLRAGWGLETATPLSGNVRAAELTELSRLIPQVELAPIMDAYVDVVFKIRDMGIAYSDRRAVKVLKLIAASALLCDRREPNASDLWVLRYVWDREEQIEPLAALVDGILEQHADAPARHPLAVVTHQVDGDDLARQLTDVEKQLGDKKLSLTAVARLKERIADLADQAAWLPDSQGRTHLLDRTRRCMEQLG
ncbi:MAG TPA: AAA family ATPase [Gemmataceae bacterium]|nr:AAA family ATPase [Gemmataceae bacterium]